MFDCKMIDRLFTIHFEQNVHICTFSYYPLSLFKLCLDDYGSFKISYEKIKVFCPN